jgi:hypothetical protein
VRAEGTNLASVDRIVGVVAAAKRAHDDAARRLREETAAARQEMERVVRSLVGLKDEGAKLRAVRYLYDNRQTLGVRAKDLAFVMGVKSPWHLRQLLAPKIRECSGCHKFLPCGWQFEESTDFVCDPCRRQHYDRQVGEEWRQAVAAADEKLARERRLNALESRVRWMLSPEELNELVRIKMRVTD